MPRGIPNRKPVEDTDPQDMTSPPEGARYASMLLKRNYRPMGHYEIVGHRTRPVMKKNPAGEMYEATKSEWVPGQRAPSPVPGVTGYDHKLWADTVVRLPIDEAKNIQRAQIGEAVIED